MLTVAVGECVGVGDGGPKEPVGEDVGKLDERGEAEGEFDAPPPPAPSKDLEAEGVAAAAQEGVWALEMDAEGLAVELRVRKEEGVFEVECKGESDSRGVVEGNRVASMEPDAQAVAGMLAVGGAVGESLKDVEAPGELLADTDTSEDRDSPLEPVTVRDARGLAVAGRLPMGEALPAAGEAEAPCEAMEVAQAVEEGLIVGVLVGASAEAEGAWGEGVLAFPIDTVETRETEEEDDGLPLFCSCALDETLGEGEGVKAPALTVPTAKSVPVGICVAVPLDEALP